MYDLFYSVSLINSLAREHNGKEVKEYKPVSNVSLLISLLENIAWTYEIQGVTIIRYYLIYTAPTQQVQTSMRNHLFFIYQLTKYI